MDLKEQQKKFKNEIAELGKRHYETEGKLGKERARLDAAKARRSELVAELADADEATEGWAQGELDKIDQEIISRKRLVEAHESALAKIATETASLLAKLAKVEQAINHAEREKAFAAWLSDYKSRLSALDAKLADSRTALGELSIAAERGVQEFGGRANYFLDMTLDEFITSQANCERHGWKLAVPVFKPMNIMLQPMVRR